MFKAINDKINVSFATDVAKGPDDIMTLLRNSSKGHNWYSFLMPGQIDYKEFKFVDKEIEISRMPNTFSPFRAFGKIRLTLVELAPAKTRIKCEVMTGNNLVPLLMTIQITILLLWSTLWILMSRNVDLLTKFGPPLAVLILFNGVSILKIRSDKRSLIDYSETIIKVIRE